MAGRIAHLRVRECGDAQGLTGEGPLSGRMVERGANHSGYGS